MVMAMLAMSAVKGQHRAGCAITDGNLYAVGAGDSPELDAVAKFGTNLTVASLYVTRPPDDVMMKFLERCGLRRVVILQTSPDGHNGGRGPLYVEYAGSPIYRVRDMVRSLEQGASI